jgi:hypothetical protein
MTAFKPFFVIPAPFFVIPAKAGIQRRSAAKTLDPRARG